MITVGASAYSRVIDFARMGEIARAAGALLFADIAHIAGLVAAGLHPSPVPHADFVTTTTHKTLRGPRGGLILCRAAHAKAIDSAVFPGIQGGPLMHVIAAKAVCFGECLKPEFKAYSAQIIRNARALAAAMAARGLPDRLRRHRQPPVPRRPARQPARAHRQEGAGDARSRPTSPATRTPCPSRPARPSRPRASAWARRPSPPAACSRPRWRRSPPASTRSCSRSERPARPRRSPRPSSGRARSWPASPCPTDLTPAPPDPCPHLPTPRRPRGRSPSASSS